MSKSDEAVRASIILAGLINIRGLLCHLRVEAAQGYIDINFSISRIEAELTAVRTNLTQMTASIKLVSH